MDGIHLVMFGATTCEIVVSETPERSVAWALVVQADGRRDPLFDTDGTIVREIAGSAAEVEHRLRERLHARFAGRIT
jgi:hypothetical protein